MKAHKGLAGTMLATTMHSGMTLGATPAMAGTSAALLKRLHEKGILSDEEYEQLLREDEAENAAPAPAAAGLAAAPDSDRFVRRTASGVGLEVGDVTLSFSGSVNGFYVHDNPQTASARTSVAGGIANVGGKHLGGPQRPAARLPESRGHHPAGRLGRGRPLRHVSGHQQRRLGALGANNGGQPTALATAGIDFRQTYLTFGRAGYGELKIGRDIGLFGSDAILNDITLLSPGSPGGNVAPANTTLGRIGVGYIYTDFQPQITYTTPDFKGFKVAAACSSRSTRSPARPSRTAARLPGQDDLRHQGRPGRRAPVGFGDHAKHDTLTSTLSYTGKGLDFGAKLNRGPVAVGYYYTASGLGTTALNLFDSDGLGNARDSQGFYAQAMATFGKSPLAAAMAKAG
jgi:hypothetical protein